jgi:hypothetical protein
MGLAQYAYVAEGAGQYREYWDNAKIDPVTGTFTSIINEPREIAIWRKHPNLQGWMEQLWISKGRPGIINGPNENYFNGIDLELTWEDLDKLESDIKKRRLPKTAGFFFGEPADEHNREKDLKFIKDARAEIFMGLKVFYDSSW